MLIFRITVLFCNWLALRTISMRRSQIAKPPCDTKNIYVIWLVAYSVSSHLNSAVGAQKQMAAFSYFAIYAGIFCAKLEK